MAKGTATSKPRPPPSISGESSMKFVAPEQAPEQAEIIRNLQLTERVLVSTDGSVSSVEAVAEPDEPEEMWTVKRG
ncbi:TPA: hypothetical protein ODN34_000878 [Escherichia coli]|nr:hypothetical protein [Escherichia coli]HCP3986947.1 hypothetical protein [Escherichia coli]HCP4455219.1 hypothetical protein [Escherichia coli]